MPLPLPTALRCLFLVAAISVSAAAVADPAADRIAAAIQVLQHGKNLDVCTPDRAAFNAQLRRDYPRTSILYGGISPQSAYWPDVEALRYQEKIAFCPDVEATSRRLSDTVASSMSPAQREATLAFFESEVGKKLLAAADTASGEINIEAETARYRERITEMYRKLDELKQRYRKDPR